MEMRKLGGTGLEVGVIGLGTEYLIDVRRGTVVSVVREAVDGGANYFDVTFAFPDYRDNFGAAFEGLRDRILVTGHLGPAAVGSQMGFTRDVDECEGIFHDLLRRLRTDYVDVLFLSTIDAEDDYEKAMGLGGRLELALRLQREGKARFIGLSGHTVPVARMAVESGAIDVLMQSINLSGHGTPGRQELFQACVVRDVGLVGMKPFAGGELLERKRKRRAAITPVQCLSYALSRPGVSTLVPGVKNVRELREALGYLEATAEERDFSEVLQDVAGTERGTCTYCNHCLPCPAGIDVGETLRSLSIAREVGPSSASALSPELHASASACTECGLCMDRCPFDVDVISQIREGAKFFAR